MNLPLIAVTMGDGAGVGPEVTVAACLDPAVLAHCRPVVIGDAERLRQALAVQGRSASIVTIADPAEAAPAFDRLCVIDLALLPSDLPWGRLSAAAGEAAYRYIEKAAELTVAGRVDAICTAPINKAALKLAGHDFPGHTELLAHLTGTPEVWMMLATEKLKVIHVTTHMGLIDAIHSIEPGRVFRTIVEGDKTLRRAGLTRRIGVCAINPHAGENGLFGDGEEERQIAPGIAQAQEAGIDVVGPLPADSLFFLAVRGDFDLVVAMYHDQGHCPVKVLGIEAGVNITVGLPVIRTSVDHGTAFDIAGRGTVDPRSMIEAMRQATSLAGSNPV
ncbi:4-hydroxythreonine-4-phosphate dehydrogenase PdxA [Propionicicella superfundia]|uniref:4-hydroxythreonine-4-phosphate dehydrogenase PdxA n=1 Tax=Propionicicella superfundia TaxID=348582 RepID=UPI0003F5E9A5|nr:4-hydroxythreonine-4-phosphate dehydrogenase PdxA [Propionicicella superfundia]